MVPYDVGAHEHPRSSRGGREAAARVCAESPCDSRSLVPPRRMGRRRWLPRHRRSHHYVLQARSQAVLPSQAELRVRLGRRPVGVMVSWRKALCSMLLLFRLGINIFVFITLQEWGRRRGSRADWRTHSQPPSALRQSSCSTFR